MPTRIQLRRTKGWRMPIGARKVDRSTAFGNPVMCQWPHECSRNGGDVECCVDTFRHYVETGLANEPTRTGRLGMALEAIAGYPRRAELLRRMSELRGRDLACWCPLDKPCHADVLLEIANTPGKR
jgi:hypothetical protein